MTTLFDKWKEFAMKVEIEFAVPDPPNFLRPKDGPKDYYIDIAMLTVDQIRVLGKEWTEALLDKADKRRAGKKFKDNIRGDK